MRMLNLWGDSGMAASQTCPAVWINFRVRLWYREFWAGPDLLPGPALSLRAGPRETMAMTESVAAAIPARVRTTKRTRTTAIIVASAFFMQNLDSTVISTALPTMARAFDADPVHMNVALTSYLLSLAVFIPASGWVADRFGGRNVFRLAIAVFTLGSILCGRAESLPFLVFARIVQGAGGAMMIPVGRIVLLRTAAKNEIVAAMAWLTTPALIGPILGPPLGGLIVTYLSWRWIFDINIPIGIIGIVLASIFIEDVREPQTSRFDLMGLLLSAVALASMMFGFETIGRGVVDVELSLAAFAVGIVSGFLYWRHAREHPAPLIDFKLLRFKSFSVSIFAGSLFRIGIGALPFLLPMMLQIAFGNSAVQSGLITFASAAGAFLMKPVAQRVLRRFGFRDTLVWNAALAAIMLGLCATFSPTWPAIGMYVVLLVGGFFRSLQFTAYNALAYAELQRTQISAATSFYSAVQQLSLTIGITVGAASLQVAMLLSHHDVPGTSDFRLAFVVIAALAMLAAPMSLMMPRAVGEEMSGAKR